MSDVWIDLSVIDYLSGDERKLAGCNPSNSDLQIMIESLGIIGLKTVPIDHHLATQVRIYLNSQIVALKQYVQYDYDHLPADASIYDVRYQDSYVFVDINYSEHAAFYEVQRSATSSQGDYKIIGISYSIYFLDFFPFTEHRWYRVRAVNFFGVTSWSNAVQAI